MAALLGQQLARLRAREAAVACGGGLGAELRLVMRHMGPKATMSWLDELVPRLPY